MSLGEKDLLVPQKKLVDFEEDILEPVYRALKPLMKIRQLKLVKRGRAENMILLADEDLLEIVMRNLFENAVKYADKGSKIIIETELENNNLVLDIRNRASGLSPQLKDRLFDRFLAFPVNEQPKGTGIGLYNVRKIIEAHGGRVSCDITDNKTISFRFSVPTGR